MPIAIIWFSFIVWTAGVGPPALEVLEKDQEAVNLNLHLKAYKTEEKLTAPEVLELIKEDKLELAENNVSPGFSTSYYWLVFSVDNQTDDKIYLELDNPHIDFVDLYRLDEDGPVLLNSTGDKKAFSTRDVMNRRFVFDLGTITNSQFLMMVDKRYASVSFPLRIWSQVHFFESENRSNTLFGVYFGIVVFVGLFTLMIGISFKDKLFLSYGIYVMIFALYIFTQLGFSFEYLYPKSTILNNYSRICLALLMVISATDFFRRFLNIDLYSPKLARIYKWLNIGLGMLLLLWFADKQLNPDYAKTTVPLLRMLYFIVFALMFSTLYVSISTWKKQKGTSTLFIAAFSAILIGSAIYILIEFGMVAESLFPVNPILLGSIVEIVILSASMVYQVKNINDKKDELTKKIAQQQKELMRAFVNGGEKERSRISAELHDNIGSNLSLLKARINKSAERDETLNGEIDQLCEDVRNLSHQLMPHELEITGLESMLTGYCEKFQKDTGIAMDLEFYSFPKLGKEASFQLYRVIQEALQNVWKHSKAKQVEIQLIGYKHEIVVTVDDNGEGFDSNHYTEGNGLLNMRMRVEAAEGTMELASYPGRGTNLLFKVPLAKTE